MSNHFKVERTYKCDFCGKMYVSLMTPKFGEKPYCSAKCYFKIKDKTVWDQSNKAPKRGRQVA